MRYIRYITLSKLLKTFKLHSSIAHRKNIKLTPSGKKKPKKTSAATGHEIKRPFKCEFCRKKFSIKDHLNRDIASVDEIKSHSNVKFVASVFLQKVS